MCGTDRGHATTHRLNKCSTAVASLTGVKGILSPEWITLPHLHDPEERNLALHDLVASHLLHVVLQHLVVVCARHFPLQSNFYSSIVARSSVAKIRRAGGRGVQKPNKQCHQGKSRD